MRCSVLLLIAGCYTASEPPPPAAGPDVLNGRLVGGVDLCEYELVAPDFPPPDEEGSWLVDGLNSPYLACADGLISVGTHVVHWDGYVDTGLSVDVQLYDVSVGASGEWIRGESLDPLEGLDDCSLIRLDDTGTTAQPQAEVVWQDTPRAFLEADDGWTQELVDYNASSATITHTYSAWLDDSAPLPADAASFSLAIDAGGTAPELDLDGLVSLPSALHVLEPDVTWGAVLPRADTTFRWDGAPDGGPVTLRLLSRSEFNGQAYPMYEVLCEVADDGEFVLPGALLAQLPAGWSAELQVSRTRIEWMGTVDGRAIRTWAAARTMALGVVLGE